MRPRSTPIPSRSPIFPPRCDTPGSGSKKPSRWSSPPAKRKRWLTRRRNKTKEGRMRSPFNLAFRAALICVLQIGLGFSAETSHAQTRKATAQEIAAIRECATKNQDNLDEGERQCLFNLVADP